MNIKLPERMLMHLRLGQSPGLIFFGSVHDRPSKM